MTKQLAYLNDPLTLEFEATVVKKTILPTGQVDALLEKSWFYPTGGGQQHDTGTLGQARVVDVFKDEAGKVIHRLDRDVAGSVLPAKIDAVRRLENMRHHSAQHLVSAVLEELLQLETLSAKISGTTPSTVDVPLAGFSAADLERVEQRVNDIVFQDWPIKSYFITDDKIEAVPFRRPPKVKGNIRVVEIDSYDFSACGGTHCPRTGMIGTIKIIKNERRNQKLRLHFVAGAQALSLFQSNHAIVTELGNRLSTGPADLVEIVVQQAEQLRQSQKSLKDVQTEMLSFEVQKLAAQAKTVGPVRLVTALLPNRSGGELRALGSKLQTEENLVALLAGFDGKKLSLVAGCGDAGGVNARDLLNHHLAQIGGKGGGSATLAQGGGGASAEQADNFFAGTEDYLRSVLSIK